MLLLAGGVVMLVLSNVLCQDETGRKRGGGRINNSQLPPKLPNNYKDIFVAGQGGKPTLGTAGATCWARGGICVHIKECPSLQMDVGVAGCQRGRKVCCKVHKLLSPTAYAARRSNQIPVIKDLQDLGASLEIIALRNSMLLADWKESKSSKSDELHLTPSFTFV